MKNKKITIIFLIIVVIVAIIVGIHKIVISYIFEKEKQNIDNGQEQLVESLKNIESTAEKESKVKLYVEENKITEEEAKEILRK